LFHFTSRLLQSLAVVSVQWCALSSASWSVTDGLLSYVNGRVDWLVHSLLLATFTSQHLGRSIRNVRRCLLQHAVRALIVSKLGIGCVSGPLMDRLLSVFSGAVHSSSQRGIPSTPRRFSTTSASWRSAVSTVRYVASRWEHSLNGRLDVQSKTKVAAASVLPTRRHSLSYPLIDQPWETVDSEFQSPLRQYLPVLVRVACSVIIFCWHLKTFLYRWIGASQSCILTPTSMAVFLVRLLREENPQSLDMHFQIWPTSEYVANSRPVTCVWTRWQWP